MNSTDFAQSYEDGLPRTKRFLFSMGFQEDAIPDLAQAAWSRAWERLGQLRDENRLLSWVNAIALNEARRNLRDSKASVPFGPLHERTANLNTAAIDVATILDLCDPGDREILQAQLQGISSTEIAQMKQVSPTAIRIRGLRARRAARELCEPTSPSLKRGPDAEEERLRNLRKTFRANRLVTARRHLEIASTLVRLLEVTAAGEKHDRVLKKIEQAISNTLRILADIPKSHGETALIRSAAVGLQQRVLTMPNKRAQTQRNLPESSVA
jgi:DNA-directed RNA polymerase specialized sigma24 family protein